MSKSSLTRVATDIIKLHISHEHYMSKNEAFYMGRKQGDVNYSRLFGEDIYKQSQFDSHLELTIPLPTKLLLRDNIDWEKIADDFIKEFEFVEKYGEDQVAAFIHYRDTESGRTKNENLHIHIAYVDRNVSRENLLYQSNKRPHAINLSSGTSCPKSKFKENALNHFKVEENTAVLDFKLVDEELMNEFKSYFGRGGKKIKDEDIPHVKTLREQIIKQAQSESIGLLVYSSRQENQLEQLAFKKQGQQQRDIATRVLNEIINEYKLEDHIEEFGYYSSLTKKEKQDKRDEALDQREQELGDKLADIPNEVNKQVAIKTKELEDEKTISIYLNVEKKAEVDGLKLDRINLATDNAEVLKKLKEKQEKELKAEQLKKEEELKKNQLLNYKNLIEQQIQITNQVEKSIGKKIKLTEKLKEEYCIVFEEEECEFNYIKEFNDDIWEKVNDAAEETSKRRFDIRIFALENYFENVYDQVTDVVLKAFGSAVSVFNNIGNQLAEKTKELTKVTADYNTKNTELASITKAIDNKNGELDLLVAKALPDAVISKVDEIVGNGKTKFNRFTQLFDYFENESICGIEWYDWMGENGEGQYDISLSNHAAPKDYDQMEELRQLHAELRNDKYNLNALRVLETYSNDYSR